MIHLRGAAPTFLVDDVGATARWYQEELGFQASFFPKHPPHAYASLRRDGVELMLLRLEGYRKPDLSAQRPEGLWDVYIRIAGVVELYERLRDRPFVRMPLVKQGYGDTEFEVRDPNGYVLVFGEIVE